MTLIERIEVATGPDRELFWEAFNTAFPEPEPGCEPVWRPENPKQPIYHAWKTQQVAFGRFVDAEAWEQAALLLVPDGFNWACGSRDDHQEGPWAWVQPGRRFIDGCVQHASTPALAICVTALRAREASHEG